MAFGSATLALATACTCTVSRRCTMTFRVSDDACTSAAAGFPGMAAVGKRARK
jgi:hypothetical protein